MKQPVFTGKNKTIVEKWKNYLELQELKPLTITMKLWHIHTFLQYQDNKPLDQVTKEDIENYTIHRRQTRKPKTVHNDITDLRLFYKWLKPDNNYFENIQTHPPKNRLPVEEILTPEEIKTLVSTARTQRDRSLIMLLWDSGCRISEILNLNINHVEFDQYGAVIIVTGKTGMRRLRLIDSVPDLQQWLNIHPMRDNPQAPLFTTDKRYNHREHKLMEYRRLDVRTVQNMLKTTARHAGITKNVHPHAIRHARLTQFAKQGFNETELRIIAGWEDTSNMAAVYVHLSGADVENKILANRGIIPEEEVNKGCDATKPVECPRCGTLNPSDAKFCSNCSLMLQRLSDEELERVKRIPTDTTQALKLLLENPETQAKIAQLLSGELGKG